MSKTVQYMTHIQQLIGQVIDTQLKPIDEAGGIVADTVMKGGYVYTFGTGHSHMMAEELFYRAGGLARVYPIFEEPLMLHDGAIHSTEAERTSGYAARILANYPCTEQDCLIIASNSGRNAVIMEMAEAAKRKGMKVIGLTNLRHSRAMASRHESGRKLFEVCDVVLDNQGCIGDAAIHIPEIDRNVAATSTVIGAMILQAVAISAIGQMTARGFIPEVFSSSNLDEGDAINDGILSRHRAFVKPL